MAGFKKLAVSLPDATFKALEKQRTLMKRTRSDAVTTAIDHWLKSFASAEKDRLYIESYRRVPEQRGPEDEWLGSTATWGAWEPGKGSRAGEPQPPPRKRRK